MWDKIEEKFLVPEHLVQIPAVSSGGNSFKNNKLIHNKGVNQCASFATAVINDDGLVMTIMPAYADDDDDDDMTWYDIYDITL